MTKELDKLEAADQWMANVASMADGSEYGERMVEYIRAHLAAQRQSGDAEMPDVNEAVYGYLDKKALTANERERDLLAGLYFYLKECGFLAAQRQAPADIAGVLDNLERRYEELYCWFFSDFKDSVGRELFETIRAALTNSVPVDVVKRTAAALASISRRPDLPNPERDADWKSCQKWSSQEAKEALRELEPWVKGVE